MHDMSLTLLPCHEQRCNGCCPVPHRQATELTTVHLSTTNTLLCVWIARAPYADGRMAMPKTTRSCDCHQAKAAASAMADHACNTTAPMQACLHSSHRAMHVNQSSGQQALQAGRPAGQQAHRQRRQMDVWASRGVGGRVDQQAGR